MWKRVNKLKNQFLCNLEKGHHSQKHNIQGHLLYYCDHCITAFDTFLLFARRLELRFISLDISEINDVVIPVMNVEGATAVETFPDTDSIFWSDKFAHTISTAKIDVCSIFVCLFVVVCWLVCLLFICCLSVICCWLVYKTAIFPLIITQYNNLAL